MTWTTGLQKPTSDIPTETMVIKGQDAYVSSSVTNANGGNLSLFGGLGVVTGSTGQLIVSASLVQITGSTRFHNGLSGSLTRLEDGTSFIVAGSNITIATASSGQLTISSTGGSANGWVDGVGKMKTTGSVSIDALSNYADAIGTDVFFYVSGSRGVVSGSNANRKVSVFGGDVVVSGGYYSNSASVLPDEQSILTGTYATRPPASIKGRMYLPTDSPSTIFRDDGVSWIPYGPMWKLTTPPLSASFSGTVNLGGASFTDFSGSLILSGVTGVGTNQRAALITAPATPYKLTVMFKHWTSLNTSGTATAGLCWREGGSGKIISFARYMNAATPAHRMQIAKYTNPTTFSATYTDQPQILPEHNWFRIEDTGTNRICSYSVDGVNFYPVHSISRTDFLTADSIGVVIEPTALNSIMIVLSWKVE